MANYDVTITSGTGSQRMQPGTYTVTAEVTGYDNSTLSPTSYTAGDTTTTTAFTVTANGTLTFNVNETGAAGGTPITAGSIVMTNETGDTDYGSPVTISATGTAVFANVPYGTDGTPITLYFRQISSDDTHAIQEGVITVNMTAESQTEYIQNEPLPEQNFTLEDATYPGLPVDGTLTFTGA